MPVSQSRSKERAMFEAMIVALDGVLIPDAMKVLNEFGGAIDGFLTHKAGKQAFNEVNIDDIVQS